jgi:hypothetical protein
MAIVEQKWSALPVPFAIETPDPVPKERYYDPDFYRTQTPPLPELWEHDDARWPPIPTQDFSNLPKQQRGLHARSFEYMRLSEHNEGHISNYQRVIDGFLAGYPYDELLPALRKVNLNPLEQPVVEIDL